jgi:hypothetical protein
MNSTGADGGSSIFKWETMRELGPHALMYEQPIPGKILEVELTSGPPVRVFRTDDGQMYFCHGLTFGGKDAPGGAVSPFSGSDVLTILENHYQGVHPESAAIAGDILVWAGTGGDTPHSAILTAPVVEPGKDYLDFASRLHSKNGRLPEAETTLEELVEGEQGYGETYNLFRRVR